MIVRNILTLTLAIWSCNFPCFEGRSISSGRQRNAGAANTDVVLTFPRSSNEFNPRFFGSHYHQVATERQFQALLAVSLPYLSGKAQIILFFENNTEYGFSEQIFKVEPVGINFLLFFTGGVPVMPVNSISKDAIF